MTLQYVPAARPVCRVWLRARPASLLMATKPRLPRPKAIWLAPLDHQFVMVVAEAAVLRQATMLAMARWRCSQTHTPLQPGVVGRPLPSDGGLWSSLLKAKLDMTCGYPYGQASMKTLARS